MSAPGAWSKATQEAGGIGPQCDKSGCSQFDGSRDAKACSTSMPQDAKQRRDGNREASLCRLGRRRSRIDTSKAESAKLAVGRCAPVESSMAWSSHTHETGVRIASRLGLLTGGWKK